MWQLEAVERTDWPTPEQAAAGSAVTVQRSASMRWPSTLTASVVAAAVLPVSTMSTAELWRYSAHLGDQEQASQRHEILFWKKALYPFACLVMVALALPFAYLHARAGGVSLKVFGGIMLGISFVLLNNVSGHLGMLRDWAPWVAAATPGADLPGAVDGGLHVAGAVPMSAGRAAQRGLLLFAHGARDAAWAAPFEAVLARVRAQRPELQVALAFLELMQPDLAAAAAQLVQRGCRQVDVVPLFLGTGGHVRRDLPLLLQRLHGEHAGTRWTLHDPIGEHPDVIEAIARAAAASAP